LNHVHLPHKHRIASYKNSVIDRACRGFIGIAARKRDQRIPNLLGRKTGNLAPVEIISAFERRGIRVRRELECPREHQHVLEGSQVVIEIVHQLREMAHQLGIDCLLGLDINIYRLENSLTHDALPHAVCDDSRKLLLCFRHNPLRKFFSPIVPGSTFRHPGGFPERRLCSHQLSGFPITVLVVRRKFDLTIPPAL